MYLSQVLQIPLFLEIFGPLPAGSLPISPRRRPANLFSVVTRPTQVFFASCLMCLFAPPLDVQTVSNVISTRYFSLVSWPATPPRHLIAPLPAFSFVPPFQPKARRKETSCLIFFPSVPLRRLPPLFPSLVSFSFLGGDLV